MEIRNLDWFVQDPTPSLQTEGVRIWRGFADANTSIAVFQYAGQQTFVSRAMRSSQRRSRGVTQHGLESWKEAVTHAVKLVSMLPEIV
jgi:hypothetical protein